MIEKSFLDTIPSILEYEIYGLITVVLLINSFLLMYVIKQENLKPAVIQIIKLFIFVSIAMVISFLIFLYFNKPVPQVPPAPPVAKEWSIEGNIELRNEKGEILKSLHSNGPLTSDEINNILDKNLKIMVSPKLPFEANSANIVTARIPENFGGKGVTVIFEVDGFHCRSENCRLELNTSNYNPNIKMIFVQNSSKANAK